ncbi:unnamed protein product [Oikopleura dioica]|uniref:Uncharacterized protein n=1 Tax=Oikopleura dioica TaxID=34765 RepID=E4WUI2_OIKDI|nr:unnamed protein product [Oikopleura dioica]
MAQNKENNFPTLKGDEDKLRWEESAGKRSISILFRKQKIEDIFIESAIKNTKTLLIGEEVCDAAEPEEYWTTIRNIKDITSLDKLVTLGLADVAKFNEKFKFDLYFKPNEIRIDHIDSTKFDLKTHCKKIWGLGKKRVARPAGLVPARQPPATTEDRENIEETISKKARKSYSETAPIVKSIGILFQDRSSQNIFWKKCNDREALKKACSLAALDKDEPTSFFVRISKPELGITYLEQLLKAAMAEFTLAMMDTKGDKSGTSKFDIMLEFANDKKPVRKHDLNHEDFDLKKLLESI